MSRRNGSVGLDEVELDLLFTDRDILLEELVVEELALQYLSFPHENRHSAARDRAEWAFIVYYWSTFSLMSYENFVRFGRGAIVHNPIITVDHFMPHFEYLTLSNEHYVSLLRQDANLRSQLSQYDPELDFVLLLLRPDGTRVSHRVRADDVLVKSGHTPQALYAALKKSGEPPALPN